ncbi:uncharacterized protein LOC113331225 isoform X2 [Papaver somniferum]|uniref:uncharacterized protein LOC113331225 isoform X2 n=1 Tax=Papaver somniferum TaxID=3469 RepID=UPI000E704895|nr:uncharacterized protein LOC113331225 isoform X2 [Papaver somniferum]
MNKTSSDISRKVPGISSMEVDEHDGVRVHDVFEMESVRSELPNNHEDHNSNPSVPTSWKDRLNSRAPREERKIGMQKLFGDIIRHNNRGPKFYLGPNGNKVWKRFKPKTERSQVICSHSV